MLRTLALALGLALTLAPAVTPRAMAEEKPQTQGETAPTKDEKAKKVEEKIIKTASGLEYVDQQEGKGDAVKYGQTVEVHYTGWLKDGTKFDSSKDRGRPFSFPLGQGRVIKGWDEGVNGMKIGGKRKLIIPPHLGYGAQGAGNVIPPNATLTFEVELLKVQ